MAVRVLIPAYNEANAIGEVIDKVKSKGLTLLVVDDGSSDNTAEIAISKKVDVLRHTTNLGKGASLKDGFNDTLKGDYESVLVLDGDGQHDPGEIPNFLKKMRESGADIVVGNRMNDIQSMPLKRKLTNKFMSYLISKIAKQEIPDTQCGYRMIKTKVLKDIKISTSKYEIESEILLKAAKKGYKIQSVPIKTIYKGQKSQINPVTDTIRFFSFLFKILREKDNV